MKSLNTSTSLCRNCRYYEPQGRRGGYCNQLNVEVQSQWTACALALPPFTPNWDSIEDIMVWQQKTLTIQEVTSSAHSDAVYAAEEASTHSANTNHEKDFTPAQSASVAPQQVIGIQALWM